MRSLVVATVLLFSAPAFGQSVTAETKVCTGSDCIEAVDPRVVGGMVGKLLGNPEPAPSKPLTVEQIVHEHAATRDQFYKDMRESADQGLDVGRSDPCPGRGKVDSAKR